MAGMRVVVVATRRRRATSTWTTCAPRSRSTATTWPRSWSPTRRRTASSRQDIAELCALVHDAGGQVYVDGANLNALVGLARPGTFGADVSPPQPAQDLLHPARRRRPGCRPGRRARAPGAVPAEPPAAGRGRARRPGSGRSSAAPWGSAGILPISWAYVRLMGGDGLTRATAGRDPQRQLRRRPARPALPGALHRPRRPGRARVHRRPARRSPRRPASPSTTSPSG